MSQRTAELPPLTGYRHFIRELRYHEGSRQILGVVLIVVFALVSRPVEWLLLIGSLSIFIGTVLRLYASGFITKNEELATCGPYALVRHPLYTGNILIIMGFSVTSAVWWTAPTALIFFFFYYPTAIEYEDRKLQRLFGKQWEQWSSSVGALIPTFSQLHAVGGGQWSLGKSARQNGEPIIAVFLLGCLVYVAWQLP